MTQEGIEGLKPQYVEMVLAEITAFDPNQHPEGLAIDFELNDVNTLMAIMGCINEYKSIITHLSKKGTTQ